MPYTRPNFNGALLNFWLFLKLGALEVGGPGQVAHLPPPLGGPDAGTHNSVDIFATNMTDLPTCVRHAQIIAKKMAARLSILP